MIYLRLLLFLVSFWRNFSKMALEQWKIVLVIALKFLFASLSVGLQCNFLLLTQAFAQYQTLRMEANHALEEKNRALTRYKRQRRRFLFRKRRRQWKNPGRTEIWWQNVLNGLMLEDEWISNFRMSREDFMALEEQLRLYIRSSESSFRGCWT